MSLAGQRIQPGRYSLIPRTLSFLLRDQDVLLLRLPEDRGAWGGLYNGIGGHIDQGEDPLSAARREILEETGIIPERLRLCGVVNVDTGEQVGIGLYIYVGEVTSAEIRSSHEGEPSWIPLEEINQTPVVEDIPLLLPKALDAFRCLIPFSAVYSYSSEGKLSIKFAE
ncbi:MAG: NUDIX domain-containing protein [Anaerolineaceae bacterium]|nr:MAG: NUDIX domain-containing protein [Anaerolineaceae bacterium]